MGFPPPQLVLMRFVPLGTHGSLEAVTLTCVSPGGWQGTFTEGWIPLDQRLHFLGSSHILPLPIITVALQAQRQSAWGKATGNEGQEGTLSTMGALHQVEFAGPGAA